MVRDEKVALSLTELEDRQLVALTSLHSTEISANVGELQVTNAISLGLLAFVGLIAASYEQLPDRALILTPAIVLVATVYLMIRVAVVLRRASLARQYEQRIIELGRLGRDVVGSRFYGRVDDIGIIAAEKTAGLLPFIGKWIRFLFAVIAAAGTYIIAIGYVICILVAAWIGDLALEHWAVVLSTAVYGVLTLTAALAGFLLLIVPVKDPPALDRPAELTALEPLSGASSGT